MRFATTDRLRLLAAAAPPLLVIHFLEEAPGFVAWFNAHVPRGITPATFRTVNLTALGITLLVSLIVWLARDDASGIVLFAWLSFLFGANAVLHLTGAIADRGYVPGLVTALLLYVPHYVLLTKELLRRRPHARRLLVPLELAASAPMLLHGYLIIFRASRLF